MYGLAVNLIVSLSGHLSNIDEITMSSLGPMPLFFATRHGLHQIANCCQ